MKIPFYLDILFENSRFRTNDFLKTYELLVCIPLITPNDLVNNGHKVSNTSYTFPFKFHLNMVGMWLGYLLLSWLPWQ